MENKKGKSKDFILGLVGGSILIFIFTSWNIVWGSLIIGLFMGLMNYELQRLNSLEETETNK